QHKTPTQGTHIRATIFCSHAAGPRTAWFRPMMSGASICDVCTVVSSTGARPFRAELPLRSDVASLPYDPRPALTVRSDLWCTLRNLSPSSYWPAARSGTGHRIGVRSSLYRATGIDITDPKGPRQVGSRAPAAAPMTSGIHALTCEYAADHASRSNV